MRYVELIAEIAGVALKNARLYREKTQLSFALAAERRRLFEVVEELPDGVVVFSGDRATPTAGPGRRWGWGRRWFLKTFPQPWNPLWKEGGWR